jgi:hypothetical protein
METETSGGCPTATFGLPPPSPAATGEAGAIHYQNSLAVLCVGWGRSPEPLFFKRGRRDSNPQPPDRQSADNTHQSLENTALLGTLTTGLHTVCTSDSEQSPSLLVAALLALADQLSPDDRVMLARLLLAGTKVKGDER